MTSRARFLKTLNATTTTTTSPPSTTTANSDEAETVDSDFVVILAALLCALICVLGLVAVARCAWLRRFSRGGAALSPPPSSNKGLKKKVLNSLPRLPYSPETFSGAVDCAICLSDFVSGEEIRVLPQCGHAFHVSCIDTWLGSHSSCPSCRQILAGTSSASAVRCQKCGGGLPDSAATSSSSAPPLVVSDNFLP